MTGNNTEKEITFHSPSTKSSLVGILLVIVAIFLYVFFTRVLSENIDVLKANLVTRNVELEKVQAEIQKINEAKDKFKLSSFVEQTESLKKVPDKMYQDQVIRDLIGIAKNYNIDLNSISFSKGSGPKGGIGSLKVSASFEGNYLDLTDFLRGLEEASRLFRVESINVQISQLALSDIERANFSLTIETYYQQ